MVTTGSEEIERRTSEARGEEKERREEEGERGKRMYLEVHCCRRRGGCIISTCFALFVGEREKRESMSISVGYSAKARQRRWG